MFNKYPYFVNSYLFILGGRFRHTTNEIIWKYLLNNFIKISQLHLNSFNRVIIFKAFDIIISQRLLITITGVFGDHLCLTTPFFWLSCALSSFDLSAAISCFQFLHQIFKRVKHCHKRPHVIVCKLKPVLQSTVLVAIGTKWTSCTQIVFQLSVERYWIGHFSTGFWLELPFYLYI